MYLDKKIRRMVAKGVIRPRDLEEQGIPRSRLYALRDQGLLTAVGRGLYTVADLDITENHTLALVAKSVDHGVMCLLTALRFHGLTTQAPHRVWVAIHGDAHKPVIDYPPTRVVRMAGEALTAGVEKHSIEGVPVRVYGAAKTVADCFKFRNKIGTDVAIEALRDFLSRRGRKIDELQKFARICRVTNVMRPYVESIA